jgi:BACON domain-containing protein
VAQVAEPADQAWGHCFAVLSRPDAAEDAAIAALRRGGRSRTAVLAHARFQALRRAEAHEGPATDEPLDHDLALISLAVLLAGTRPAVERAVLDLDARLDRPRLARALGLSASAAATNAADIGETWERLLDPAVLAWLGPGECPTLAELLDDRLPTVDALLAAAPVVADHADSCEICGDRRRSMVSVRALFGQWQPPPVPDAVRAAGRAGRLRLPSPMPPPLDADERGRRRRVIAFAVVIAVVVAAATTGGIVAWQHRGTRPAPPADLAVLPASATSLSLSPSTLSGSGVLALRNTSGRSLSWQASTTADWVSITPASGQLAPGQEVSLGVVLSNTAPPGAARVTVAGSDGSAAASDVNGAPGQTLDVAATSDHCNVRAQVIDDVDVAATLHYQTPGQPEQMTPMANGPSGFQATLPSSPAITSWWVIARDSRGASGQTPPQTLSGGSC